MDECAFFDIPAEIMNKMSRYDLAHHECFTIKFTKSGKDLEDALIELADAGNLCAQEELNILRGIKRTQYLCKKCYAFVNKTDTVKNIEFEECEGVESFVLCCPECNTILHYGWDD